MRVVTRTFLCCAMCSRCFGCKLEVVDEGRKVFMVRGVIVDVRGILE